MASKETALQTSFDRVKTDVYELRKEITLLKKQYTALKEQKVQSKTIVKRAQSKRYVASKTGTKFHIEQCPFAKNIKPKSRVYFKSKIAALNAGYKPCICIK